MPLSPRKVLKSAAAAGVIGLSQQLFPSWMPKFAFAQDNRSNRDVLVVLFQRGGMDGLNVVVPYGEGSGYYDRRPTIGIPEPDGGDASVIDLNGFFGLHPALRPLKDIYDAKALNVIHGVGSPDPTRSHFDAMEYMERGIPGDKVTGTGWITRHLNSAAWQNESPFRAVGMGSMVPSSLRGNVSTLALRSIADFHLSGRENQLALVQKTLSGLYSAAQSVDLLTAQAAGVFNTIDLLSKFAGTEYVPANHAAYPDSGFGLGLRQTAQLIKADVGLEVAAIDIGGWDTHDKQGAVEGRLAKLLRELAQGMAAFYADLGDGMSNVSLVTMSEFGRRAAENASGGTDHGRATCMFVMGGGATGTVHADWKGLSEALLDDGDLPVTTDYRDILSEILIKRVKNPRVDQIFPGYTPNLPGLIAAR